MRKCKYAGASATILTQDLYPLLQECHGKNAVAGNK